MKLIDDYVVDPGEEKWCGVLIILQDKAVWIFDDRPHGYDITFGLNGNAKGYNWDNWCED